MPTCCNFSIEVPRTTMPIPRPDLDLRPDGRGVRPHRRLPSRQSRSFLKGPIRVSFAFARRSTILTGEIAVADAGLRLAGSNDRIESGGCRPNYGRTARKCRTPMI
jgi:hypothetical protein